MARKIFFKLIHCEDCGQRYVAISDRKIQKYLCSGYSRQITECKNSNRYAIEEKVLLYLIQIFCNRNKIEMQYSNEFMKSIVDKINISRENDSIIINYKNGEKGIYSSTEIHI